MHRRSAAVVVLFCRRPQLGWGKRRLARTLGAAAALTFEQALLQCALEDLAAWPGEVCISPESPADTSWAQGLLGRGVHVHAQPTGNLGERLNAIDASLRRGGHERLIFIGSDSPSLGLADLSAAQAALRDCDVALAPAADGGVIIMAARLPWPDLAALPWGEAGLGEALVSCCRGGGLSVAQLRHSYDVDQASDLLLARLALAGDERPARRRLYELLSKVVAAA